MAEKTELDVNLGSLMDGIGYLFEKPGIAVESEVVPLQLGPLLPNTAKNVSVFCHEGDVLWVTPGLTLADYALDTERTLKNGDNIAVLRFVLPLFHLKKASMTPDAWASITDEVRDGFWPQSHVCRYLKVALEPTVMPGEGFPRYAAKVGAFASLWQKLPKALAQHIHVPTDKEYGRLDAEELRRRGYLDAEYRLTAIGERAQAALKKQHSEIV